MIRERKIKKNIIAAGKKLAALQLVCASSGNLSCRRDAQKILITATGSSLGDLRPDDIVAVSLATGKSNGRRRPSSELLLHRLIYKHFSCRVVIHCHPPLTNAFFAVCRKLPVLTFEARFYLGDVPVVAQKSLTVTRPGPVIAALAQNRLVVLKNHGVVCIGKTFADTRALIQILEEAVKIVCIARLFNKKTLDSIDRAIKSCLRRNKSPSPRWKLMRSKKV